MVFSVYLFLNTFLLLMHLKIITQRQVTPVSITNENNPIKTFHILLLLSILSLLFIIVSLIILVHSPISLPTNLFLQTQFL